MPCTGARPEGAQSNGFLDRDSQIAGHLLDLFRAESLPVVRDKRPVVGKSLQPLALARCEPSDGDPRGQQRCAVAPAGTPPLRLQWRGDDIGRAATVAREAGLEDHGDADVAAIGGQDRRCHLAWNEPVLAAAAECHRDLSARVRMRGVVAHGTQRRRKVVHGIGAMVLARERDWYQQVEFGVLLESHCPPPYRLSSTFHRVRKPGGWECRARCRPPLRRIPCHGVYARRGCGARCRWARWSAWPTSRLRSAGRLRRGGCGQPGLALDRRHTFQGCSQ